MGVLKSLTVSHHNWQVCLKRSLHLSGASRSDVAACFQSISLVSIAVHVESYGEVKVARRDWLESQSAKFHAEGIKKQMIDMC